jgi:acetylornithine deacetylase/succinyl-diaminopimelate desuccinylase-like protein
MTDAACLLRELLRIPSVTGTPGEMRAVEWLEARLSEKGIPSERVGAFDRPNLVARLPGNDPSLPKLVLLSHLDVVPAKEPAWRHPPFEGAIDGGRLFGRGALDTKQLTVMELIALFRLRETGHAQRDVVLIASVDEEKGSGMGAGLLSKEMPELFQDAVALSEGAGFPLKVNGRDYLTITVGEKACCRVRLTASGQSGHAGAPGSDQAVVKLAGAIEKVLEGVRRLPEGGAVRRAMAERIGETPDNPLALEFLKYSGSCGVAVPPFKIGVAVNVLPAETSVELEIRPLPGTERAEVEGWLEDWLRGAGVGYEILWFQPGVLCPPDGELFERVSQYVEESAAVGFPSKVLPIMALGRTDGRFFSGGSRVFGFSPLGPEDAFDRILPMVHGADESVSLSGFEFGCRVFSDLVERLAGG